MPLKLWECSLCGELFKTKVRNPTHCPEAVCREVITPPSAKFLEKINPDGTRRQMVGQAKILRERARAHTRDVELDDLVQKNSVDVALQNRWIKDNGQTRKKIDDL